MPRPVFLCDRCGSVVRTRISTGRTGNAAENTGNAADPAPRRRPAPRKESSSPDRRPRGITSAGWASPHGDGHLQLHSAQANQINTETFIRFNEYVDAVVRTQARELAARRAARRAEYDELHKHRLENPNDLDVLKGDALNDVLKQLLDPEDLRIGHPLCAGHRSPPTSSGRSRSCSPRTRREFSMSRLTMNGKGKWPIAFQDPRFAPWLKSYQDALDVALEQAINARLTKRAIAGRRGRGERPAGASSTPSSPPAPTPDISRPSDGSTNSTPRSSSSSSTRSSSRSGRSSSIPGPRSTT